MRIYFDTMDLPKKAAKRVQKAFTHSIAEESPPFFRIPLHTAQFITARMLGYTNWHQLEQETKKANHLASKLDEQLSVSEQYERIAFQASTLNSLMNVDHLPQARRTSLLVRVSSADPFASSLIDQPFRANFLEVANQPGVPIHFKFEPSNRSLTTYPDLYFQYQQLERGLTSLNEFMLYVERTIAKQPENIFAMMIALEAIDSLEREDSTFPERNNFGEGDLWNRYALLPARLEDVLIQLIPVTYFTSKQIPLLEWSLGYNRELILSIYYMGVSFFALKNYRKAKKWLKFLRKCVDRLIYRTEILLFEMDQSCPQHDIHLLSAIEVVEKYNEDDYPELYAPSEMHPNRLPPDTNAHG